MKHLTKTTFIIVLFFFISSYATQAQSTLRYFEFSAPNSYNEWRDTSFVVATSDPAVIASVESELQKRPKDRTLFFSGRLVMGSNGYNKNGPYEFPWHVDENNWNLAPIAIELCDGVPYTDISLNLDYWINTVKMYCGWLTRVKREVFPFSSPCEPICIPVTVKKIAEEEISPCANNVVYPTIDNIVTLESYGLDGKVINKLEATQTTLIAATNDGVYYKEFSQKCWNASNLKSKNVQAIVRINSSTLICSTTQAIDNLSMPQLHQSTDNGKTWSLLPNNFTENNGQFVKSLAYNPNSNTLYAGGNGVIASSADGGSNWTLIYGAWNAISKPFLELTINLTNNEVWAGGQNALDIQVIVRFAQNGNILGEWSNLIPAPSTVEKIIIKNGSSTTLLMGGEDGILKSNDNGLNWENIYHVPNQFSRFYFGLTYDEMKPNRIIAASWNKNFEFPQPLILHFSEDNGQTWKVVTTEGIFNFASLFGGTRTMVQRQENGKTVLYLGLWKGGVYKAIIEP